MSSRGPERLILAVFHAFWCSWGGMELKFSIKSNKLYCAQSYLTLGNAVDCCPQVSSVPGISQATILDWVAFSYSRGSSRPRDWTHVSWVSCIGRWILYHWATWWRSYTSILLMSLVCFYKLNFTGIHSQPSVCMCLQQFSNYNFRIELLPKRLMAFKLKIFSKWPFCEVCRILC